MSALEPVDLARRETISTEITRRLLAYLLAGNVRPGEKIPSERKLAEALGVGRSVVREALKSLTLLGLVDVRQGDGTYLRRADSEILPQSIEWGLLLGQKRTLDLVEARRYLEVIVAGLAAERRDDRDLEALRGHLGEMEASAGDPDRFVAADVAFHLTVAQASRNDTLDRIMSSVRSLLHVWISRVMHSSGSFQPSVDEHAGVLAALETGDADAAREAMQVHMDSAYERLASTLREHGEQLPADSHPT